jgi:S-DNA-T family DNA segregation ATPase FtsK/SpoIIIE
VVVGFFMLAAFVIAGNLHWPSQQPMTVARRRIRPEDEIEDEGEEDDDRVGFFSMGMVIHALLSTKARLGRAFGRMVRNAMRPSPETLPRVSSPRMEPNMGAASRSPAVRAVAPAEDDGDDIDVIQPQAAAPRKVTTRQSVRRSSSGYQLPSLNLLTAQKASERTTLSNDVIQNNAVALESVLGDFGVRGEIINARPGPVVTLYELEPAPGIKSSRVIGLADDIARSMSAVSARVAVVSGRNAIGIELPNPNREKVYLRQLLDADDYNESTHKLPLCLGKTIGGDSVIVDLARMPHLLIAGTTGSGKSVAINTMILSLLYRLRPDQCRLIMVDPKMLELSVYDNIPHLLTPVVTDPKKAVVALKWAVREMEGRYKKMSKLGVRNIDGYNIRVAEAKAKGETLTRTVHTGYDKESGQAIYEKEELDLEPLPYIVVIVDEMADLMMVAGKDIEGAVQRLAQMARAAGIHVILATQRPSVDVITGTIKANFPTRISFQVTSKIDSRTILGEQGAEQLLGQGDMLYMAGGGRISRVHGPFVSDDEVEKVVRHLKSQGAPEYLEEVTASTEEEGEDGGSVFDATGMGTEGAGDLYEQAVAIVRRDRKASTSYIQRRLQIGYNRAASLMERLEQEGVVGQPNHAGKREILLPEVADEF